jgi:hemerythrin
MMIEFDESLITGNDTIDTQHRELIERISKFVQSCEDGQGRIQAIKMLDYMSDYTDFHFGEEEKLQESVGYPELKEHKAKHAEFKQALEELREFLEESEGPTESFVERVQINVVDWLFRHIKGFDRSVAEYIHMRENASLL